MKYTEFTGKTVEEAVEKGLQELGLTAEQADIRVLEEGKKKLFKTIAARVEIAVLETENSAEETEKATWTMWVYENNQFVLKTYGVQSSSADPVITPGADCKTAVYENGKWTIRSGYGFTLSYTPTVVTTSGYNAPDSSAYTDVQYVIAEFPEFNYADSNGNCRTLVYVDGKWQFVKNTSAADNERVHFIPVWFVDGDYTVSVTASRVWTPAGVISATRTSNSFAVDGSIYDDYFVGN